MTTHFDKLHEELEAMTKAMAMPKDDDDADPKIAAAAADGGPDDDGDDDEEEARPMPKKGKGKGKPFGKSMTVTLEDGTEVEAEDGTELVKSLTESFEQLTTRIDEGDTVLGKALGGFMTVLKAQGTQLAAIQAQVKAIAGEGRGRKAVVNLLDKPNAGGGGAGDGAGFTPEQIMAKATTMYDNKQLLPSEIVYVETSFNRGNFALPEPLLRKIIGSAA
jgi:hypothetical protein